MVGPARLPSGAREPGRRYQMGACLHQRASSGGLVAGLMPLIGPVPLPNQASLSLRLKACKRTLSELSG